MKTGRGSGRTGQSASEPEDHQDRPQLEPVDEPAASGELEAGDHLVGQVLADRYRVLELLGVGGMGSVYRGEHIHMRNPVALKVLHSELVIVPEIVARFEREAVAAARINDPHVVNATDYGRLEDGSFYLALEFVQGRGLDELLEDAPFDQVRALKIARQITHALVSAHAAGVIHRDLKPENVMLVRRPNDPEFVKVLDFGIAKVTMDDRPSLNPHGQILTQLGSVFGTPDYMAPEQASGAPVDHRADLYTVGVLLYEMLSGRAPFESEDVADTLYGQINEPPPPLPIDLNASLERLVMTLLHKNPDDRIQTAEQLLTEIDAVLLEFSVVASLPDSASAMRDFARSAPSFSSHPDQLASAPFPSGPPSAAPAARSGVAWWVLALPVGVVVGAVLLVGVGWALWQKYRSGAEGPDPAVSGSAAAQTVPSALPSLPAELLAKASTGDPESIAAIEARDASRRSVPDWVALARGQMHLERYQEAIDAYSRALDLDPALSQDRVLLSHLRRIADDDKLAEAALTIAATHLGSDGADLLYNVWVATRAKTDTTTLAKQLVYSPTVRARATPALAVALDLREAEGCEAIKPLLARATLHGDIRTYRVLTPLLKERGCGPDKKDDCYECLREGSVLKDALAASRNRAEPSFSAR